jgi:hypothetical protein
MPLKPGSSAGVIAQNIREMRAAGHPERVAIAAAEHTADKSRRSDGRMEKLKSSNRRK